MGTSQLLGRQAGSRLRLGGREALRPRGSYVPSRHSWFPSAATESETVFLLLEILLWLCASYQYEFYFMEFDGFSNWVNLFSYSCLELLA